MQAIRDKIELDDQAVEGIYHLSGKYTQQLLNNHIPLRKRASQGSYKPSLLIYTEEMAYLMMACNHQFDRQPSIKIKQVCWDPPHSLIELYQSLNSNKRSYHSLQCLYFYLKVRKLSKLLYREPIHIDKGLPLLGFRIFGRVEDYESEQNGKKVVVVSNEQKISDILDVNWLQGRGEVLMYIVSSMDGIFVKLGQPFGRFQMSEGISVSKDQ